MQARHADTDKATQMAKLHQSIRPSHGAGKGTVTVTDSDTGSSIELPLQPLYGVEYAPSFPTSADLS